MPGSYTWTGTAYASQDCTEAFTEQIKPTVSVHVLATPTPAPTPTPDAHADPDPDADADPDADPDADADTDADRHRRCRRSSRSRRSSLPTLVPAPTPTPTPTPTPVADAATPVPTPTRRVGATSSPAATPSKTAKPSPSSTDPSEPVPSGGPDDAIPNVGAGIGSALIMAGFDDSNDDGDSSGGTGTPAISLSSDFTTAFGEGFDWAVPGLVLSVPGLLLVLAVIGAQAMSAFAWLPVVRRRIGAFEVRRPFGRLERAAALDVRSAARLDSADITKKRAMNGTSTRQSRSRDPAVGASRNDDDEGMAPGASGPNTGRREPRTSVGSGAERQRYRAAPIGHAETRRPAGQEECGIAE